MSSSVSSYPIPFPGSCSLSPSGALAPSYWIDPNSLRASVSALPIRDDFIQLVANILPGEEILDLNKAYELFVEQQKDAYNRAFRKDAIEYSTPELRSSRLAVFRSQEPASHLGERFHRVELGQDRNPDRNSQLSTATVHLRKCWLAVHTPDSFKYSTVIVTNDMSMGLLHALVRHGHEFVENGFRRDVVQLWSDVNMKRMVKMIRDLDSRLEKTALMRCILSMSDRYEDLNQIQQEAHKFIQSFVKKENYLGEGVNISGQEQVFFRVSNRVSMVLALSEQLYFPKNEYDKTGKKRPLKTIITVFFTKMDQFQQKKDGNWPITRSQA